MATSAATVAAAIAARARREVIEQLKDRGAVDPQHAVILELRTRMHERQLGLLTDRGIVHDTGGDRFWVDLRELEIEEQRRRESAKLMLKVLMIFAVVVVVVAVIAALNR